MFWYVLPPPAVHPSVAAIQQAVDNRDTFSLVPLPWLHVTLVLTTASLDDADALLAAAQSATIDLKPFEVAPKVTVFSESVVCEVPGNGWMALRDAIAAASQPFTRPSAAFLPHMSVAYAHGDGDASTVRAQLAPVSPPPPWTINEVSLVAVRQRPGPAEGWYDWTSLGVVRVGG